MKTPQESKVEEPQEIAARNMNEASDMQRLLHTLEVTQQRLRNLTPIRDLSFER